LEQVEEGGKISFKASGQIDFFGDEALTRVGGAGARIAPRVVLNSRYHWRRERGSLKEAPGLATLWLPHAFLPRRGDLRFDTATL
jgi:hypothetical protein